MASELAVHHPRQLERSEVPDPEKFELYTRKRREQIITALTEKRSFLSDAARHAGIPPRLLSAWLSHGEQYPKGPLGRFAREVRKIQAEHNDDLKQKVMDLAEAKKDWQGIARIGEQYDAETWSRPSEKSGTNVTVNIIDKLNQVHAEIGNPLTSGD